MSVLIGTFADLPGYSLLLSRPVTPEEPDVVLVDDENMVFELLHLMCCGDTEKLITGARNRKLEKLSQHCMFTTQGKD